MKTIKRLFLMVLTITLVITLSSCNHEYRNTSVPMGSINTSEVVASTKDYNLTSGDLYTRLRSKSYDAFQEELKKVLFAEELTTVASEVNLSDGTVTDTEQEAFDTIASAIYSTSSAKNLAKIKSDELETMIAKYIDSNSNKGITITSAQCKSYVFEGDKIRFTDLPQDIIDNALINIAMNLATRNELNKIVDNEKIEDEDGNLVTNTNYIKESDLQNYYEANMRDYGTYRAIIIQFNNLTEARNVINAALSGFNKELNDSNALEFYTILYNTYYNYRTPLAYDSPFSSDETNFVVNSTDDELTDISSTIKTFVTTTLQDNEYLKEPFNQNNKYIMVYRGTTTYDINEKYNVENTSEVIEWDGLKEAIGATNYTTVHNELKKEVVGNKISSYSATVLQDRIEAADIKVFDPYYEYRFYSTYSDDYKLISAADYNNDFIFSCTYNNKSTSYKVDDFYAKQRKAIGLTTIIERLQLDYVDQFTDVFLDSDEIADLTAEVDDALSAFNKNQNSAYPSNVGEATYLLGSFGYSTRDDVVKYAKIATSVLSQYLTQTVFDEWATEDHKIDTTKLNILENLLNAGNTNYSNLFSINIDHILIFLDDNADGTPDDPSEFIDKLSDAEKANYNAALLDLSKAIYEEANCDKLTEANDLMDILDYIVKAYNRNDALFSQEGTSWSKYKKYNFQLKVEKLSASGDTNESNVSNYVTEFGDYVKALYKKAVEDDITIGEDEPIIYFKDAGNAAPESLNDLCETQFGYHMIIVNSYSTPSSTAKSESDDKYGYQKDFEVLINELDEDTEDDNIFVVVENTYNEEKNRATMNQFFTYYVQAQTSATSTLDSSIQNLFSSMFGDAIARYTSSGFQNYLLFVDMNIQTTDTALQSQLTNYKGYLMRTSQSYATSDDFTDWYGSSLNWSRPYSK